jgi:hypothetical protein
VAHVFKGLFQDPLVTDTCERDRNVANGFFEFVTQGTSQSEPYFRIEIGFDLQAMKLSR